MIAKHADYTKNKNIEVIGMSIDRSKSKWKAYLETHEHNWVNYNQFGSDKSLYKDLEIQLFPTYLVVNNKGDILHKSNRFKKALEFIEATNFKNE
nr:thioredoxin-like domain-containing protein [Winogradskyella endarachnes]